MDKQYLAIVAKDEWGICGTDLLIRTNFASGKATNRALIIVCTREFENVPQPTIWNFFHKNPAHAVGYSDGTVGLISPTAFTNLELDSFVSVSILATNLNLSRN